jgi:hypothetical protein
MRVTVFGASSGIGHLVVQQLLEEPAFTASVPVAAGLAGSRHGGDAEHGEETAYTPFDLVPDRPYGIDALAGRGFELLVELPLSMGDGAGVPPAHGDDGPARRTGSRPASGARRRG